MITILALLLEALFFGAFVFVSFFFNANIKMKINNEEDLTPINWIVPAIIGTIWYFIHLING